MNIKRKKIRTLLSISMIAMGVAAIMVMTALADGLFMEVKKTVSQVQGIIVFERSAYGPMYATTDEKIIEKIKNIPGVKKVTPIVTSITRSIEGKTTDIASISMTSTVRLFGTVFEGGDHTVAGVKGELLKGRNLKPGEKGSVVIGEGIADEYNTHQ
ncbi:MAG: ABC transporter permease, partial [Candidatus Diapherotrites archaeon]